MPKKHDARQRVKRPARIEGGLIYLPLTNGTEAFVDDTPANRDLVLRRNWQANAKGYAASTMQTKTMTLHRMLMPNVPVVDHVNRNILDNRACNLREATHAQNRMNSKPGRGRTVKGAYPERRWYDGKVTGKWVSSISILRKLVYIGTFDTEQAAHDAWMARARERDPNFVRGS